MAKKVMVSGCFDMLHSGHVAFLQEAATYGDVYVALGSDRTIHEIKGRTPVNDEEERLFMVRSLGCVKEAFISKGSGMLDFLEEFHAIHPDILIVNEDGNLQEKRALCQANGVEYRILKRQPHAGLTRRSTTALRGICTMPFRIDLAGGWLDQPFVSRLFPGPVITTSIHPTIEFNDRSGMASSTRRSAIELWGPRLPAGDPGKLAKILFCYDNPPGTRYVSGSQDSIGIIFAGLNLSVYEGEYWPVSIECIQDEDAIRFVENALYLVPLGPRVSGYDVLENRRVTHEGAKALAEATLDCWRAIKERDIARFGSAFRASFEAQIAMFPNMMNNSVATLIDQHREHALGWKLSGAGGGGYLILVNDQPVENAIRIHIRRIGD